VRIIPEFLTMAKFSWSLALVMALCLGHLILAADTDVTTPTDPDKKTTSTTEAPTTSETTTPTPSTTTSTTTPAPSTNATTTTTPGPTPTPTPKPERPEWPYNIGEWSYTDETKNVTCIRIRGAFELYFPYEVKVNETVKEIRNGTISIPKDPREVNVTGDCGKHEQSITLNWISADVNATKKDKNYLTLTFGTNTGNGSKITDGKFALTSVEYMVTLTNGSFPNATEPSKVFKIDHLNKEQVPIHKSYKCLAKRTLKNEDGEPQELKIASSQFEAFRNVTGDKPFSPSEECSLDGVTDIVPIAVGASLAGLVVVVLIAYLIGRRRSRARGYQSV